MAEAENLNTTIDPQPTLPRTTMVRRRFLKTLRETANVSRSARAAGISTSTAYRQRARHKQFREAWDDAMNEALDNIEQALTDRAVNGVERQHFHGGQITGSYRTYSDQLGMFILRGRRADIYGRDPLVSDEGGVDSSAALAKQLDIIAARVKARDVSARDEVASSSAGAHDSD